jgi:hypothetical protein
MTKRIFLGGLLAVGVMAASAGTASAQFVPPFGTPAPFGGSFGGVYGTPSGGVVQKYGFTDPFSGTTYINKTYSNPFTGVVANRNAVIPGYGFGPGFGTGFYNPGFAAPVYPVYRQPVFVNPGFVGPGFGYGGANLNFGRPGLNVNIGFGRIFP